MKTPAQIERELFAARLRQCLLDAGVNAHKITQVTREFNARFADSQMTICAVRKWLLGQSIPTQARIQQLAGWLGVDAAWLRFGNRPAGTGSPAAPIGAENARLLADLNRLSKRDRAAVRELVRVLVRTPMLEAA